MDGQYVVIALHPRYRHLLDRVKTCVDRFIGNGIHHSTDGISSKLIRFLRRIAEKNRNRFWWKRWGQFASIVMHLLAFIAIGQCILDGWDIIGAVSVKLLVKWLQSIRPSGSVWFVACLPVDHWLFGKICLFLPFNWSHMVSVQRLIDNFQFRSEIYSVSLWAATFEPGAPLKWNSACFASTGQIEGELLSSCFDHQSSAREMTLNSPLPHHRPHLPGERKPLKFISIIFLCILNSENVFIIATHNAT